MVEVIFVVVGVIVDSWDKLRESVFRILVCYLILLLGLELIVLIEYILYWVKGFVSSFCVWESDVGVLVFCFIFCKYVFDFGWIVNVYIVIIFIGVDKEFGGIGFDRIGVVIVEYVEFLNDWLEWGIDEGDKDFVKVCLYSFVYGVLLIFCYIMEELLWILVVV